MSPIDLNIFLTFKEPTNRQIPPMTCSTQTWFHTLISQHLSFSSHVNSKIRKETITEQPAMAIRTYSAFSDRHIFYSSTEPYEHSI